MTRRHRRTLARLAAAALFTLTACTPSTTASITPTPVATSASPTPSPTPTYGPNQTAAIAVVTGYYAFWNTARQNPQAPHLEKLTDYMPSTAYDKITPQPFRDWSALGSNGYRQVGDMVIVEIVPDAENATRIPVTFCLDRTPTKVVDLAGATVTTLWNAKDELVPAAEVLSRSTYTAVVEHFPSGRWLITQTTGGTSSCGG